MVLVPIKFIGFRLESENHYHLVRELVKTDFDQFIDLLSFYQIYKGYLL